MLEFVDSGLIFVQDENNFINLLLQIGFKEKSTGSNEKVTDPDSHPCARLEPFNSVKVQSTKAKTKYY